MSTKGGLNGDLSENHPESETKIGSFTQQKYTKVKIKPQK
jgi:hypothetical protein